MVRFFLSKSSKQRCRSTIRTILNSQASIRVQLNMEREVNCPVHHEDIEVAVLSHVHMDPTKYVRKIAETSGVSRSSVQARRFHPSNMT